MMPWVLNGCRNIATEIVRQSIIDWRYHMRKLDELATKSENWKKRKQSRYLEKYYKSSRELQKIEIFFFSKEFSIFCDLDPDKLLKRLQDDYENEKKAKGGK